MTHNTTISVYLETRDTEVEIELECEFEVENDGIGPYEFWGQRGIDKGHDYVVIFKTDWDKTGFTAEEIAVIELEIDKQKGEIESEIEIEDREPDYDPCDKYDYRD